MAINFNYNERMESGGGRLGQMVVDSAGAAAVGCVISGQAMRSEIAHAVLLQPC